MAAPAIFHVQGLTTNINYILGAAVWAIAIISLAEVARAVRLVNILAAIAIMVLPWLIDGGVGMMTLSRLNNLIVGALVIVLSIPLGKIKNAYGNWNRPIVDDVLYGIKEPKQALNDAAAKSAKVLEW
jgi:hypothetical protein